MAQAHPQLAQMHELRGTLAQLRNNRLAIGRDGRNRTLLGPFGTKTGRNAPSNSKYIFGPAKCLRFLIRPAPGTALIHRDFSQQEVWIAAIRSGDEALLTACQSGDIYLGIAAQLGFETRPGLRALFKIVVLSILYGASAPSLAARTGISPYEAREILARLRARFRRFEEWCGDVEDRAGLRLMLSTGLGWTIRCEPSCNSRTIRNWPIQSDGAAILHVACVLAERRGLHLIAPIRPRPNSRVTSRQIGRRMRSRPESSPEAFETAACDPRVMDGVFWVAVPEVILDEPQIVAAIGEIEAA
jgi:DNA polymerase family A